MIVTEELMKEGMSLRGSWSLDQLRILGVSIPLGSGWRKRLIGSNVSEAQVAEFLRLKNKHMTQKGLDRLASQLLNGKDPKKRGIELLDKEAKKRQKKVPDVDPEIEARAQMLVKNFTGPNGIGSHTTTCVAATCSWPKCSCT